MDIYPTYYAEGILTLQNTTFSSNTYQEHTIIIENSTVQNNAKVNFKAEHTIEIQAPFEAPLGSELYLGIHPCNEIERKVIVKPNNPNPFSVFTIIECYIEASVLNAELQVYDKCGNLVKSLSISERGETSVQIYANELQSAGVYTYLLVGDEEESETIYIFLE